MEKKQSILRPAALKGLVTAFVTSAVFGLGFLVGPVVLNGAHAAGPNQTATSGSTAVPSAAHKDQQFYTGAFEQDFASRLGVDKTKLNTAFSAALSTTLDQAVQNGDLDANVAAKLKNSAQAGLGDFVVDLANSANKTQVVNGEKTLTPAQQHGIELMNIGLNAAAQRLGMASGDELRGTLKRSGLTLSELAQQHNTTVALLRQAMLDAAKSAADANVHSGKWTQGEADEAYTAATAMIADEAATYRRSADGDQYTNELAGAALTAGGTFLHLPVPADFGKLVKQDNKTLTQIAQEHNVTLDALRNAMLSAARTAADANATSGKWTKAQADGAYNNVAALIDKLSIAPLSPDAPANKVTK